MFNIESAQGVSATQTEQLVRFLVVAVLSMLLFGALFPGVWFLEY